MTLLYTGHEILETYKKYVRITWLPTMVCNYHCYYCYGQCNPNIPFFDLTEECVDNLFNNIQLNYGHYDYIKFVYGGGEPTLCKERLFSFLNRTFSMSNIGESILHTNMSPDISYFKKMASLFKNKPLEINASIHTEFVDDLPKLHKLIDKIKVIENSGIKIYAWLMIGNKNKELCYKFFDIVNNNFNRMLCSYKFIQDSKTLDMEFSDGTQIVAEDKKNVVYVTDTERIICNADEIMLAKKNKFRKMFCMGGVSQLAINHDGTIYATECKWNSQQPIGEIGCFYKKNVELKLKPILCLNDYCGHTADIYIPKVKFDYLDKLYKERFWGVIS